MAERNHVRLKPLKPPRHTKQDFGAPWGTVYVAGIWVVHTLDVERRAAFLETIHNNSSDDGSALAFDVCTEEEAERIKAMEEAATLEKVRREFEQHSVPAPTQPGGAQVAKELNLPPPVSELAASSRAKEASKEETSATKKKAAGKKKAPRRRRSVK
jgi:hypothetical protein